LTCDQPFADDDVVDINMSPEDQEVVRQRLLAKVKKSKKKDEKEEESEDKAIKKVKREVPLNKLEQLDGDISDVIRGR
jgi:hypothetical protein